MNVFPSEAERYASEACDLPAFGGLSLAQTRKDLGELLGKIGSFGFFDEYTKHDISHIDAMLGKLDWLVTAKTREAMTPADWLLVVLAVYFHDLGMLVTKSEYQRREESDFPQFRQEALNASDPDGRDYLARLNVLGAEEREKFLYQEFVRHHHAARVRKWIEGDAKPNLGVADAVVKEVESLLRQLDPVFREDLGKVCESHHLDDLYDVAKYPVDWYYGSSERERANVQFAAILLRSVDLLHITSDRTPSVAFRVFNPADPISQNEWSKQAAVKAVVAKKGVDKDGVPSDGAPRDTIEVYATFTDANGYFALTSYLKYAAQQLRLSHEWAQRSNDRLGSKYLFPWRAIDTTRVVARGFLKEPFQFTIDQQKVLDLLTGHTLYNDTNVVLRELLQNSIDAVRLKHGARSPEFGRVEVHWDSAARTLEICDNGTGMTQSVIENNLLRACSSLYQDPEFRKRNPDFNPISRFGIGVLSTFMVADQVEIITCHPEEEKARQLSLRSVHGQYLVRTLDKIQDVPERIRAHGTIVRLTLRPSAEIGSVVQTARHFVVLPECEVVVREGNGGEDTVIGHRSIGEALKAALVRSKPAHALMLDTDAIRVVERHYPNMSIAFAIRWNEHFREWTFLIPDSESGISRDFREVPIVGVCVAGVRVEDVTPGFTGIGPIVAMSNSFGASAPRTDVARSSLESTPEYADFIRTCFSAYCDHVIEEVRLLETDRNHSITWATQEAAFISNPLMRVNTPVMTSALRDALYEIPYFLVEEGGVRKSAAVGDLRLLDRIETVESAVTEHVEYLLREFPGGTRESVVAALGMPPKAANSPGTPVLCTRLGVNDQIDAMFLADWEIESVSGDFDNRACVIGWTRKAGTARKPRWSPHHLTAPRLEVINREDEWYPIRPAVLVRIPLGEVAEHGFPAGMRGFIAGTARYLLPGHPWQDMVDSIDPGQTVRLELLSWLISQRMPRDSFSSRKAASVAELEEKLQRLGLADLVDWGRFAAISRSGADAVEFFDTRKWQR
ncbi:ATP-binding protein [Kitasatospora sp. NPDC058032]|uniref:HD domain-containing protein n=1 Tax=Kitasatospora sp. NPDC058032 TaxID=3346307 RepID=UPI0036DABE06